MSLMHRILAEKRSWIVPLAAGIVLNVAAYALAVRPLARRSAGAADRASAANAGLTAAERDLAAARDLVSRKSEADQELSTFYDKVLPADLPAARRMTYAALPALARKSNVKYEQRRTEVEPIAKDQRLGHLHIRMVLQGDYENVRRFIYELETAPTFVIIDDVTLVQNDPGKPLTLTLELSTYYKLGANGD